MKFTVSRSDVTLEAGYQRPQFALFRDTAPLLSRLTDRLSVHGLKLSDVKFERGNGSVGDFHMQFFLLEYVMTVRVRLDRADIYCIPLTEENQKRIIAAAVDTFNALRESIDGGYRAYAVSMNIHGILEGQSTKDFLARLVAPPPTAAGATVGNGVSYYFAPVDERIASFLTLEPSALIANGLFVRPQATWDASRLALEQLLPERAEEFVRRMLASFNIGIP